MMMRKVFILSLTLLFGANLAVAQEYGSVDLSTAYDQYHIPSQHAITINTGDTVVIGADFRLAHNGLGAPLLANSNVFGLMVTDSNNWWAGNRSDLAVAARGNNTTHNTHALGNRLPGDPWVENWVNLADIGIDSGANLEDLDGDMIRETPKPIADHVEQESVWLRQEMTLQINAAGNVEYTGTIFSLDDPTLGLLVDGTGTRSTWTIPNPNSLRDDGATLWGAVEAATANGGPGYQDGATIYGGFTTAWNGGIDDDMDPSTPKVKVPHEVATNYTRADVDNFTVTKNGVVEFTDDFSTDPATGAAVVDGDPIGGGVGNGHNWNPRWSTTDPDGVPDSGDEDTSQQLLFTSVVESVVGGGGPCDYDANTLCDIVDIDMLTSNIGGALTFDVDGSGVVDAADISAWLVEASLPGNPYLGGLKTFNIGDIDLDGDIDSTDLGQLLNNFGDGSGLPYSGGNLNGDLLVDSTDLGLQLNGFGFTSAAAAAVPEPGTLSMLLIAAMGLFGLGRRR